MDSILDEMSKESGYSSVKSESASVKPDENAHRNDWIQSIRSEAQTSFEKRKKEMKKENKAIEPPLLLLP